jgi:NAD(P)H-dependent flavin oxidoreductase YrpB (nitropropane dioxygenase family)
MKSELVKMFDLEMPVFAFSHCRDVVCEVSKAGGMGVLGIAGFTPDRLRAELNWIDEHVGDKTYGVDLLIPANRIEEGDMEKLKQMIPEGHRQFVQKILDDRQVPELPEDYEGHFASIEDSGIIGDRPWELLNISLEHPKVKVYVNALGTPPKDILEKCHSHGVMVGGMAGKVRHGIKQKEAGVDFIIGTGFEAAGHTGDISTMVLVPQLVEAVAPLPVLAAGGIVNGKQIAASMCLGAQGVWTGSVWLSTKESELTPGQRKKIMTASSAETIRSRCLTGKPVRMLTSGFTEAWASDDAPNFLPMPLQSLLTVDANNRFEKFEINDMFTYPVGQGIGMLNTERSVRQTMYQMMEGYVSCLEMMTESLDM